jgi:hypothetical protein
MMRAPKDKSADWLRLNAKELDTLAEKDMRGASAVSGGAISLDLKEGEIWLVRRR